MQSDAEGLLIVALEEMQARLELPPQQFAAHLGISYATWYRLLRGDRRPGKMVLRQALKCFPHLRPEVLRVLSDAR